jgi:hypothetical protein
VSSAARLAAVAPVLVAGYRPAAMPRRTAQLSVDACASIIAITTPV